MVDSLSVNFPLPALFKIATTRLVAMLAPSNFKSPLKLLIAVSAVALVLFVRLRPFKSIPAPLFTKYAPSVAVTVNGVVD